MGQAKARERRKERGRGDTVTQGPGAFGRGGEGTKKSSIKQKISMKEVYMDKNQAVIKQKDIKHRTTRLLQKVTQETKHKAIYIRM